MFVRIYQSARCYIIEDPFIESGVLLLTGGILYRAYTHKKNCAVSKANKKYISHFTQT
jgi:hypothetical protein